MYVENVHICIIYSYIFFNNYLTDNCLFVTSKRVAVNYDNNFSFSLLFITNNILLL